MYMYMLYIIVSFSVLHCLRVFVCAVLLQRGGGPAGGQDADHLPAHPVRAAHHPCTDRLTFPQRSVLQRVSG